MNNSDMPNLTAVRGFGNFARYGFLIAAMTFAVILTANQQPWLEFAPIKAKVVDHFSKKPI